jgi:hypothetical protein
MRKKRILQAPKGHAEETLFFIRALDHGILPPHPWGEPPPHDAKISRESKRKFRKQWRKAAGELDRRGYVGSRSVYSRGMPPSKPMERRRRAMVNDMLTTEVQKLLNNKK